MSSGSCRRFDESQLLPGRNGETSQGLRVCSTTARSNTNLAIIVTDDRAVMIQDEKLKGLLLIQTCKCIVF
jgi:hypothetical protein